MFSNITRSIPFLFISFGTVEGDANGFLMYVGESDEFPTLQVS